MQIDFKNYTLEDIFKLIVDIKDIRQQIRKELIKRLRKVKCLDNREKNFIVLHWGFWKTYEEIAKKFNVSKERVRQMEDKIFRKLEEEQYLKDFNKDDLTKY